MSSASSVTTFLPTGAISHWCLAPLSPRKQLFANPCPAPYHPPPPHSSFSFSGSAPSPPPIPTSHRNDFQSICCDGHIVDTSLDIYNLSGPLKHPNPFPVSNSDIEPHPINLSDLICCGISGTQTEALSFTPSPRTTCAPGTAGTPLASLAATNVSSASLYPVTYASDTPSANPSATVTNDLWGWGVAPSYGASGTPVCLWVNTVESDVSVAEVTVPATYVAPTASATDTGSGSTASPTSSAAVPITRAELTTRLCVTLGLMALGVLFA
ncbi:uncharacterized protein F4822DRAFT_414442 [Hypoxylon trugodes]|uniref:uncharacterized protein n=1 Tax=Hypoxylon trugodes TaxID=326681 RepID=UPI0021934EF3|nr:uncharacterized protein F4822DRAFT_414442 [Hypoxylon trugodes]KAI1385907.1 hypothetical protein F4822DRAFT_414442 [Hypoxylon trugodes]